MTAKKIDPMEALVSESLKKISAARAPQVQGAYKQITENAGHKVLVLDMGANVDDFDTPVKFDIDGYSLVMAQGGSDAMAVAMELVGVGVYGPVYPGCQIDPAGKFKSIICRRWGHATTPAAGTFTLAGTSQIGRYLTVVVAKKPQARYSENGTSPAGFFTYRNSQSQVTNGSNTPIGATEGISARGARAIRAFLRCATGGATFTAGTIRWWYQYDGNNWAPTGFEQPLPLTPANNRIALPEFEVAMKHGRYFPEASLVTDSAANGTVQVLMGSFGEGGELNAGEVRP